MPEMNPAVTYGSYLKIDELLSLQEPGSDGEHDEMLFIIIHQVYERQGYAIPDVQRVLIDIYRRDPANAELCERLVDLDEGLQEWRTATSRWWRGRSE